MDGRWKDGELGGEDDDALMVHVGRGEGWAFEVLYRRWARRVMAYAYRSLNDRGEAEDVVQETFLALHRSSPRYKSCERFGAFLFRIAGNAVRSRYRKRIPFPVDDEAEEVRGVPEEPLLERVEDREDLGQALLRLHPEQREVLLLAVVAGLGYREIGVMTGISEDAVAARIYRARKRLREILGPRTGKGGRTDDVGTM